MNNIKKAATVVNDKSKDIKKDAEILKKDIEAGKPNDIKNDGEILKKDIEAAVTAV
jgi:putative transposon-encoded protein